MKTYMYLFLLIFFANGILHANISHSNSAVCDVQSEHDQWMAKLSPLTAGSFSYMNARYVDLSNDPYTSRIIQRYKNDYVIGIGKYVNGGGCNKYALVARVELYSDYIRYIFYALNFDGDGKLRTASYKLAESWVKTDNYISYYNRWGKFLETINYWTPGAPFYFFSWYGGQYGWYLKLEYPNAGYGTPKSRNIELSERWGVNEIFKSKAKKLGLKNTCGL